jgi:hypothetical protein
MARVIGPAQRLKIAESVRRSWITRRQNGPIPQAQRDKQSVASTAWWERVKADPEAIATLRSNMSAGTKAAWARRKAQATR